MIFYFDQSESLRGNRFAWGAPGTIIVRFKRPWDNWGSDFFWWVREQVRERGPIGKPGCWWRATNDKKEPAYVRAHTIRPSLNHADNIRERGLSVADSPHYISCGYRWAYQVSGRVIGLGSDGEPLLDISSLRVESPLYNGDQLHEMVQAARATGIAKLAAEIGWSPELVEFALHEGKGINAAPDEHGVVRPLHCAAGWYYFDPADPPIEISTTE